MRICLLAVLTIVLCGCPGTVNLIQSIALAPGQTPALNSQVDLILTGLGKCVDLAVDWADGTALDHSSNVALSIHHLTHTYSGWPGGKTVTVQAVTGCEGTARTRFMITPSTLSLGWNRDPQRETNTCYMVSNLLDVPDLAPNSLVHITSPADGQVNFRCPFNGCIYNADGKPGTSASAPFQFPGLREYSLVLRVAGQLFQGGTTTQFTTASGGPLEVCQNDNNPSANITGAWGLIFEVDQLGK
jgi:hypothetical protein